MIIGEALLYSRSSSNLNTTFDIRNKDGKLIQLLVISHLMDVLQLCSTGISPLGMILIPKY